MGNLVHLQRGASLLRRSFQRSISGDSLRRCISEEARHKEHLNAGWQITGSSPLIKEKSEVTFTFGTKCYNSFFLMVYDYARPTVGLKHDRRQFWRPKHKCLTDSNLLFGLLTKVGLVRHYNCALGRPNKKTFIALSKLYHGSTRIAACLSGNPTLYQKFQGSVRAFSSHRIVRKGTEFANDRPLKQFTLSKSKSAGRNSAGRITIFHRGGGAKRLQRRIDVKRSTSSMGIIERIEYDPNRSSRIALVRWEKGVHLNSHGKCKTIDEFAPPLHKVLEPTTATICGSFSFSSLPGKVDQRKVACFLPRQMATYVTVGLPTSKSPCTSKDEGSKKSSAKDIFFSTLSSPTARVDGASLSLGSSFSLPRIAVAGAKPAFFGPRMKENFGEEKNSSPCEIRKLTRQSFVGAHRIKRKAAVSWQSFGVTEHNESKQKMEQVSLPAKPTGDRVPLTYIIATHHLKPGDMVMNCDWSIRP